MKKITLIISIILALLMLSSCGETATKQTEAQPKAQPFTVNGETVTTEEIEYFKGRSRADIINEYAEKYSVTDFSDFWDKDFDGKTPTQALEERAEEQAIEAKIKLVMMRENEVYEDISYSALKAKAEKYNKEHENLSGTVGITSIDLSTFYTYYISTGEMELKNILAEGELKPDESQIEAVAEENPELSENGIIDLIVSEEYEKIVKDKIKNAEIQR